MHELEDERVGTVSNADQGAWDELKRYHRKTKEEILMHSG